MESFSVNFNDVEGRLDCHFYKSYFRNCFVELQKSKFRIVELKKLCKKITDGTHYTPKYIQTGIPFLSVKDVRENEIFFDDSKFISLDQHRELTKRCKPEPRDILLTKIGTVGLSAVIPNDSKEFSIFVSVALLKINTNKANPYYISTYLNSKFTKFQIERVLKGIGVPDLHLENIAEFKVPLPPIEIQNRIVKLMDKAYQLKKQKESEAKDFFDSIDTYIMNKLEIKLPKIKEMMCYVINFDEISGSRLDSFYYMPKFAKSEKSLGYSASDIISLGELIEELSGGATPKVDKDYYSNRLEGIPFLRVQNIGFLKIIFDDLKYLKKEVHEDMLKRSQLKKDDLVFTITGRIGSVAVIPDNFAGNINQHSIRLHLKNSVNHIGINPYYVASFLNTHLCNLLAVRKATGATRPALDYKALKSIKVVLPSLKIQNKIAEEVKKRMQKAEQLKIEAVETLDKAKEEVERIILG